MKRYLFLLFLLIPILYYSIDNSSLEFARRLASDHLYDEALIEISNIINSNSSRQLTDEAMLLKAEILQDQKKYALAEEILKEITDSEDTVNNQVKEKALANLIRYYSDEKKYMDVIRLYKRLFILFPLSDLSRKNSIYYLEAYYNLKEYNDVISEGRILEKNFGNDPINAEILLLASKAFLSLNLPNESSKLINEIKVKYPESQARWKSIELLIALTAQEKGEEASIEEIKKILKTPLNRSLEEKLLVRLSEYYISKKNYQESILILNTLTDKFNFSPSYDYYLVLWMESSLMIKDVQPVISKIDFISRVMDKSTFHDRALASHANALFQSGEPWKALSLLSGNYGLLKSDSLKLEYKILNASIKKSQGNYTEALFELISSANQFAHLSRNADIFLKIAEIYRYDLKDPSQALLYYFQTLALTLEESKKNDLYFQIAQCYESMNKYPDALDYYNRINTDQLEKSKKEVLYAKQYYLQLFMIPQTESFLKELVIHSEDKEISKIYLTALTGWDLKDFPNAVTILNSYRTPEAKLEALKLQCMLVWKSYLENDTKNTLLLVKSIKDSLLSVNNDTFNPDIYSIQTIISYIEAKGILNNNIIMAMENLINQPNLSKINFNNLFRLWLWRFFRDEKIQDKAFTVALEIKEDRFIRKNDLLQIYLYISEQYYYQKNYSKALEYYSDIPQYLNLSNPQIYYHYAICLYQLNDKNQACQIIQTILQNNLQINEMKEARYLIANNFIEQKDYSEAISVILAIPPNQRTDQDYILLSDLYEKTSNINKEKEALLFIKEKNIEMLRRLADLHEQTLDLTMAEYTWSELVKKEKDPIMKANALFSLSILSFNKANYQSVLQQSQQAFSLLQKNYKSSLLKFNPSQMAKLQIISCYRISNRPKADALLKEYQALLKQDPDAVSEIKINEAIYYNKIDKDKSVKILNGLIKDKYTKQLIVDQAYLWRGTTYFQLKKYDDAEADLILAGESEDKTIKNQAFQRLGTMSYLKENYTQAMDYYHFVILNDSTGTLALDAANNYAIVAKITKNWEKAVQAYQWIISRWGDQQFSQETRFNIAFCYYQAKLYDRSLEIFEQYQNNFSSEEMKAEAMYWIAENYYSKGKYEESVSAFLKVSYTYPSQTKWAGVSELRAGEVYIKLNQNDKARLIFEKIITKYGSGSDVGKEAQNWLKTRN